MNRTKGLPLVVLVVFASCGSPNDDKSKEIQKPTHQEPGITAEPEPGKILPVERDPIGRSDSSLKSLEKRIEQAIGNAQRTYEELNAFKERMFDDGIAQSQFILCAGIRIQKLKAKELDLEMGSTNVLRFRESIRQLFDRQRLVLLREEMGGDSWRRFVKVAIPSSANARERSFSVMRLQKSTYPIEKWSGRLEFEPHQICIQSLLKPLPAVSEMARKTEIAELGKDMAGAVKRLDFYFRVLPQVENRISEMVTLETRLRKVLGDYRFDQQAASSVIISELTRHEESPRRARALLQQAQTELVAAKPSKQEIADVIRCF